MTPVRYVSDGDPPNGLCGAFLRASVRIGRVRVDAFSDGMGFGRFGDSFGGATDEEWMSALGIDDPDTRRLYNIGCYLVRGPGQTVMIDSGYGGAKRPPDGHGWGELHARMREVGASPDDVQLVVHTHLHEDHLGGDVNLDTGELVFRNARVLAPEADLEYWTNDELGVGCETYPDRAAFSRPRIELLREHDVVDSFQGEAAVCPAVTMVPTPGHTPGHSSALVSSDGEHLLITGDAASHPLHFEHLDWIGVRDVDRATSIRSREYLAALVAECGALVTGGHFPIPTFAHVIPVESGYRWRDVAHRPSEGQIRAR